MWQQGGLVNTTFFDARKKQEASEKMQTQDNEHFEWITVLLGVVVGREKPALA
jgi:hypothetical protein